MDSREQPWDAILGDIRRYVARRLPASEVEDAVQDVLLRLVSSQDAFDPDRPLAPWVQTVARNAVIDRQRKRTPSPPAAPVEEGLEDRTIEAQTNAQRTLLGDWLRQAVERLPEPYRQAVHRVDVLGQPQAEVADALGLPYSTLKSRVQRGRTKVREMFSSCCEAELDARGRVDAVRSRNSSCC